MKRIWGRGTGNGSWAMVETRLVVMGWLCVVFGGIVRRNGLT
jgi:hypothetical protein